MIRVDPDARIAKLRNMKVEDDWVDKFYAALEALEEILGRPMVARGTPPHVVMADLLAETRYKLGLRR